MSVNTFLLRSCSIALLLAIFSSGCKKDECDTDDNNNSGGTPFTCEDTSVSDIDGNVYAVVTIGSQCWMQQNLNTATYNDGEAIPNLTVDSQWTNTTDGAWCDFQNEENNSVLFGKLYNWYAVNTGKLCPEGWRIPSAEDWNILWEQVDFDANALRAIPYWTSPNEGATNSSDFSALPGGSRVGGGAFVGIEGSAYFYSTDELDPPTNVRSRSLFVDDINNLLYENGQPKDFGYSCRCLKGSEEEDTSGYNCVGGSCIAVDSDATFVTFEDCQSVCSQDPECNIQIAISSQTSDSATAEASGGNPPYQYIWSNGQTGPTATNLAAGTYTVIASEVNNTECMASTTVTVTGSAGGDCCDCTGVEGLVCVECCDGEFDMEGESWEFWVAFFTAFGCNCN